MKLVLPAPLPLVHSNSTAIGNLGMSKSACALPRRKRKLHSDLFELLELRCDTFETPSASFRIMPTLAVLQSMPEAHHGVRAPGLEIVTGSRVVMRP